MSTITSANSVVALQVKGLFPVPQVLQSFGADRAWETANVGNTESRMTMDGKKVSGYIFNMAEQTFTLQPNSPSRAFFTAIQNAQRAAREVYVISGTIDLPATGESYICTNGTLKDAKPLPNAGKVLDEMTFVIEWESIQQTIS